MKIVIADLQSNIINGKRTGHYLAVAKNYKELFGENCMIAGGPVYKDTFSSEDVMELPYNVIYGQNIIIARLKTFANAISLFKKAKGKVVVIQHSSVITTFICLALFYHRNSKVYLIQYKLEGFRLKIGQWLFSIIKNKIEGVICPNKNVGEAFKGLPYCIVPDYIYTGTISNILNNDSSSFVDKKFDFCIVGRIAPGKGCIESARKFANTKYKFIIAGKPQTEEMGEELHKICDEAKNIELRLGYISDLEYNNILNQSRYTIMNYQDEYSKRSSGVVFDTVFAGVPVVGCRCRALQFIEDNCIGYIYEKIEEFDPEVVMNENLYYSYRHNIVKYCDTHMVYKNKLKEFIKI